MKPLPLPIKEVRRPASARESLLSDAIPSKECLEALTRNEQELQLARVYNGAIVDTVLPLLVLDANTAQGAR